MGRGRGGALLLRLNHSKAGQRSETGLSSCGPFVVSKQVPLVERGLGSNLPATGV